MIDVKVSEVIISERARVSNGSLETLERSVESLGLLHPIGITKDKHLIFGGRRLQACKNIGMETIPARVFDIKADDPVTALRMERAENEGRLDLTPSEKIALGMKIEEALTGRNHRPSKESTQNLAELPKGESRDIAAKAVNMNRETYRQAKKVVESGNREAIEAMDTGLKSINAAYQGAINNRKQVFKITLCKNPADDAKILFAKGGSDYCTKLALALLKAAGHSVDLAGGI